jgi:hypothetical protein
LRRKRRRPLFFAFEQSPPKRTELSGRFFRLRRGYGSRPTGRQPPKLFDIRIFCGFRIYGIGNAERTEQLSERKSILIREEEAACIAFRKHTLCCRRMIVSMLGDLRRRRQQRRHGGGNDLIFSKNADILLAITRKKCNHKLRMSRSHTHGTMARKEIELKTRQESRASFR